MSKYINLFKRSLFVDWSWKSSKMKKYLFFNTKTMDKVPKLGFWQAHISEWPTPYAMLRMSVHEAIGQNKEF